MTFSNTDRRIAAKDKQLKALEMRIAGASFFKISEALGLSGKGHAYKLVMAALKLTLREPADALRQLEVERLDDILSSLWPLRSQPQYADRILKTMERRSKLLGLDAPVKIQTTEDDSLADMKISVPAHGIAVSFSDVYRDIADHEHSEYILEGGRGSTKSSFVSLVLIELLVNNPEWHALVLRQVANTLRDSVFSQLMWAINYLGLSHQFSSTVSPIEITYLPTRQKIYFRGGDDPLKVKSLKPRFGYINILWFEELDQFRGPEAVRNILQSAVRGGEEAYIFKTYNPPRSRNNWVHKEIAIPKPNRLVHHSDYSTVPKKWLGQAFIEEAEFLKEVNPLAFEHEYLGVANSAGGLVFENVEIRKISQEEIDEFDRVLSGLDFGYYPDPLDWGKLHFDAARQILYIFDEFRANKMSNRQLYDYLVEHKDLTADLVVVCDSAEPKSVADLRDYGMTARPAEKGPESVYYSHKWLQSLVKIVIDPERAPYAAQEFLNYEYDTDADGNYISAYPDRDNHSIDMSRYATNHIWRRRGQ